MKFNIDGELEFKINNVDWTLRLVNPEDIGGVGETNYCAYDIAIDKSLKPSQMILALRHELSHAFRWTYAQISEMELMNIPGSEVEELICNFVEVFGEDIITMANKILELIKKRYEYEIE